MAKIKPLWTAEGVVVKQLVLQPGQEIPWHRHTQVGDTFYVLRGVLTIYTLDPEATTLVQPGDTFRARVGQPHRVYNASDEETSALLIQGVGQYDYQALHPDGTSHAAPARDEA